MAIALLNLFVLIESSSHPHPHRNTPAKKDTTKWLCPYYLFAPPFTQVGAGVEVGVFADI